MLKDASAQKADELKDVDFPPAAQGGTEDEATQAAAADLETQYAERRMDIESIYQKRLTDEPPLLKAALVAKLSQWPNWLEAIRNGPNEVTGMLPSRRLLLSHFMLRHGNKCPMPAPQTLIKTAKWNLIWGMLRHVPESVTTYA